MKMCWESGGIAPCILNLGTTWTWVVTFTPRPLYPRVESPRCPYDKKLGGRQNRYGRCGEEKKSYHCPSRELNTGRPARSLVTILTELPRLYTFKSETNPLVSTTTCPLRSHWHIGQQLSVVEVSVAFKFFIETGLLALCSSSQPGGPGLHIYIPWRMGGPVIPPGTEYPF
jgi:hypothetical protein